MYAETSTLVLFKFKADAKVNALKANEDKKKKKEGIALLCIGLFLQVSVISLCHKVRTWHCKERSLLFLKTKKLYALLRRLGLHFLFYQCIQEDKCEKCLK